MQKLFKKSSLLNVRTSILYLALLLLALLVSINGFLSAQLQQLPAPTISVENPVEINTSKLSLSWDILDEKTKYAFELCMDTICTQKVKSFRNLSYPGLTISNLESGQYYWRVSGVDENKNLGHFSTPQPLLVNLIQLEGKSLSANQMQGNLVENTVDKPANNTNTKDLKTIMFNLPWYIYLIILTYLFYIIKTLIWYINK